MKSKRTLSASAHGLAFAAAKLAAAIAAVLVLGCAPPAPKSPDMSGRANLFKSAMAVSSAESNWNCPSSTNVNLKDNIVYGGWDYTGNEDFTVCVAHDNPSQFKVSGTTGSGALCFYPMRTGYTQKSGYTATPTMADTPQCYSVGNSDIVLTFSSSADINYMVIVDANHTDAMNECLSSSSPCPPHSEGFVQ